MEWEEGMKDDLWDLWKIQQNNLSWSRVFSLLSNSDAVIASVGAFEHQSLRGGNQRDLSGDTRGDPPSHHLLSPTSTYTSHSHFSDSPTHFPLPFQVLFEGCCTLISLTFSRCLNNK